LLTFDPEKRLSAEQALAHPYFVDLHLAEDEPSAEPVNMLDFEFEFYSLTKEQLKGS
jgi:serine/threonine protein kinase